HLVPPDPTPFPYTTLFRSVDDRRAIGIAGTFTALGGELGFGVLSVGAFALLQFGGDAVAGAPLSFLPSSPLIGPVLIAMAVVLADRKSTRLNSSHVANSYA